jgi:hypothetical protein
MFMFVLLLLQLRLTQICPVQACFPCPAAVVITATTAVEFGALLKTDINSTAAAG